jgi:hypothetical protein
MLAIPVFFAHRGPWVNLAVFEGDVCGCYGWNAKNWVGGLRNNRMGMEKGMKGGGGLRMRVKCGLG